MSSMKTYLSLNILEAPFPWNSWMYFRTVHFYTPAETCHYVCIRLFFYRFSVVLKYWWNHSLCSLLVPLNFPGNGLCGSVNNAAYFTLKYFEIFKHLVYQFNVVFRFEFAKKISDNCSKWNPWASHIKFTGAGP